MQPAPRRRRPWIPALIVVAIVAAAVGGYFLSRPSGPGSVQELSALLVDAPGKTSTVETHTGASGHALNDGAPGARWSASRIWQENDAPGSITLTQFDTSGHASETLAVLHTEVDDGHAAIADVPGLEHAFTVVNPNTGTTIDNATTQPVMAAAAKGTILVVIFTASDRSITCGPS